MNNKQMLEQFSNEFVKFRESFHNAMNNVMDFEMTNGLYETQERSSKRLDELDKLIDEKNEEVKKAINLPSDQMSTEELEALKTRNAELVRGYQQEKDVIANDRKDLEEQYEEKINEFRVLFKKSIEEMKKALGFHVVKGKDVSMIDVLKGNLESRITTISYQLATLHAELNVVKGTEDRKHITEQMQNLVAQRKKLEELYANLDKFMDLFNNLEDYYVNAEEYVNAFDLERYSKTFEEIADAVVTDVDNTLISVNIITNEDGTYSLDMRCGNKICEPRPLITADKFTKNMINQYLEGFASALALKTDLKYDDLVASKVILKTDGVDLGRHEFKTVGEMAEKVKEGKRDEVLAAAGKTGDGPENKTGDGPENKTGDGPENKTGDGPENKTGDGPENKTGDGPENKTGDGPENKTDPSKEDPSQTGPIAKPPVDDYSEGYGEPQSVQGTSLPELDAHAMKVNGMRNARAKFYNGLKTTALIAATGLGFAGPALGIGMAGALVAAGIGIAGTGREAYVKLKENIKYRSRVRQMKNLAKLMSNEAGVDIVFDMDLEKRQAGFKLQGDDQFLTTADLRDPNLFPEGMDDAILDVFENGGKLSRIGKKIKGVNALNKYRGLGDGAKSLKETRYKNFPVITFDNVSAAFNDFGGVKSQKELNNYQFDYNTILQARREEQEEQNRVDENDNVESVDPLDLEGIENELEQGEQQINQQQNLDPTQQQTQQQNPEQTQQQTQQQQNPAPVTGQQTGTDNAQQQQNPVPVVVQPLGPSNQDPNVTGTMFPPDVQEQLKSELVDWVRGEVQDSTNGIEVADKLEAAIKGRKDELSEQSKIDLVNLFHDEVKFTEGQMEKFDFICRNDRTLTDFEVQEAIAKFEQVRATQGEAQLGMAVSTFLSEHSDLTKEDLEALHRFDMSKDLGFEEAINSKFNGQGPTR